MPRVSLGWLGLVVLAAAWLAGPGCTPTIQHNINITNIPPMYLTVDVNIRVDKQLDDFFKFEDEAKGPATQPATLPKAGT